VPDRLLERICRSAAATCLRPRQSEQLGAAYTEALSKGGSSALRVPDPDELDALPPDGANIAMKPAKLASGASPWPTRAGVGVAMWPRCLPPSRRSIGFAFPLTEIKSPLSSRVPGGSGWATAGTRSWAGGGRTRSMRPRPKGDRVRARPATSNRSGTWSRRRRVGAESARCFVIRGGHSAGTCTPFADGNLRCKPCAERLVPAAASATCW